MTIGGLALLVIVLATFMEEIAIPLFRWLFITPFDKRDQTGSRFWWGVIGAIVLVIGVFIQSDPVTAIGIVLFLGAIVLSIVLARSRRRG